LRREDILGGDRRGDPIASDHEGTGVHRAGERAISGGGHIANFAGLRPGAAHRLITQGSGKVVFQQVSSSVIGRCGLRL